MDEGRSAAAPATLPDGLHTLEVGGETFRVLVKTTRAGERIAVAQESGFRNEIARDGALRTVMPILIPVPILLLIVADTVRKMFRPIAALSRRSTSAPNRTCTRSKTGICLPRYGPSPWPSTACSPASAVPWSPSAASSRMRPTSCARR